MLRDCVSLRYVRELPPNSIVVAVGGCIDDSKNGFCILTCYGVFRCFREAQCVHFYKVVS